MSQIKLTIDHNAIKKKFEDSMDSDPRVKAAIENKTQSAFSRVRNSLLREFNNHVVTVELRGKQDASNLSGTLSGRTGNLFSFLGFMPSQDPVKALEKLLKGISIKRVTRRANIVYYSVIYPDPQEIANETRLNWGNGRSWAYGIEDGNFRGDMDVTHFIFRKWSRSRSERGFQIKGDVSATSFSGTPYISQIINNFIARVNNMR